jgi:hypothetical protein
MTDSHEPQHAAPSTLGETIAAYRKAIAGLLVPALVIFGGSLLETSDGKGAVTPFEWVTIVIAALGTSGTVAIVANRPPRSSPARPAAAPPPSGVGRFCV